MGCDALEFVAMASKDDLDANADFIRLADSYVPVPAGKNTENYANVDLICEIARQRQVDAVWPWVERFDRRGTEPFELFKSEFGQNIIFFQNSGMFARNFKNSENFKFF